MISFDNLEALEVVAMKLDKLAEQGGFTWTCWAKSVPQGDDEETPTLMFGDDPDDEPEAELCWIHEFSDCGKAVGMIVDALQRSGWEVQLAFKPNDNRCDLALFKPGTMDGPMCGPDSLAISILNVIYELPMQAANHT